MEGLLERATYRRESVPKSAMLARKMALELDLIVDEYEIALGTAVAFVRVRSVSHRVQISAPHSLSICSASSRFSIPAR